MVNPDAFSALKSIFKSSKASEDPSPYSKHGVKDKHKPGTTSSPPHSHSHPTHPQPLTTRDQRRASRRYSGRPAVNDGSATLVGLEDKVLAITKRHADTNVGKAGQEDERVGRNKSKSREKSVRFNEEVQIENLDALRWADDVGPEGKTFVLKPNALGAGKVFGGSMDANLDHLPREDLAQVDGTAAPVPHDQQRRQSMDKKTIWKEDFTKIIRIRTGPSGFIFEAYHSLLYRCSSYYFDLCNSLPAFDCRNDVLDLRDVDMDIFALYLTYLTTGDIEAAGECVVVSDELAGSHLRQQMFEKRIQLIECYVCAEKVGDKKFGNYIMDALLDLSKSFYEKFGPPQGLGRGGLLIFERTRKGTKLRRLEVEIMFSVGSFEGGVSRRTSGSGRGEMEKGTGKEGLGRCMEAEEFWCEVARCGMRVAREGEVIVPPWVGNGCRWHDHGDKHEGWTCTGS